VRIKKYNTGKTTKDKATKNQKPPNFFIIFDANI
jgi:hypothetical protein